MRRLYVSYVYSSNGDGYIEQNLITGQARELSLDEFPSPGDLYKNYKEDNKTTIAKEKILHEPYYFEPNYKTPIYYQRVAINRAVESIAGGRERAILVCATGARVIILIGCINVLMTRISETFNENFHALIRYNCCKQYMKDQNLGYLICL